MPLLLDTADIASELMLLLSYPPTHPYSLVVAPPVGEDHPPRVGEVFEVSDQETLRNVCRMLATYRCVTTEQKTWGTTVRLVVSPADDETYQIPLPGVWPTDLDVAISQAGHATEAASLSLLHDLELYAESLSLFADSDLTEWAPKAGVVRTLHELLLERCRDLDGSALGVVLGTYGADLLPTVESLNVDSIGMDTAVRARALYSQARATRHRLRPVQISFETRSRLGLPELD